jgi:hypothetical protein
MDPHDSRRRRLQDASTCRFAGAVCAAGIILSCAAALPAARATLITNGGFEASSTSLTGWTVSGDGIAIDTSFGVSGTNDAAFTAVSGNLNAGVLSQNVTTTAGTQYTLAFALLDQNGWGFGLGSETFTVSLGTFTKTLTAADFVNDNLSYANYSFTVPGSAVTGSSTTLSFQGVQDAFSSSPVFNLDNVSLTPVGSTSVPEPSSLALLATALGFGMLGLAGSALRRRCAFMASRPATGL